MMTKKTIIIYQETLYHYYLNFKILQQYYRNVYTYITIIINLHIIIDL